MEEGNDGSIEKGEVSLLLVWGRLSSLLIVRLPGMADWKVCPTQDYFNRPKDAFSP